MFWCLKSVVPTMSTTKRSSIGHSPSSIPSLPLWCIGFHFTQKWKTLEISWPMRNSSTCVQGCANTLSGSCRYLDTMACSLKISASSCSTSFGDKAMTKSAILPLSRLLTTSSPLSTTHKCIAKNNFWEALIWLSTRPIWIIWLGLGSIS